MLMTVDTCVLRFMSVRVHVRVRTLVRSADFVRIRVRTLARVRPILHGPWSWSHGPDRLLNFVEIVYHR